MLTAADLANKVNKVLEKQVIKKGYEVNAVLLKIEKKLSRLDDFGCDDDIVLKCDTKIIITNHDVTLFPMGVGDNPEDFLDFIWIAEKNSEASPNEGMFLLYENVKYIITAVSPTYLGGKLIIKECRCKRPK